LATSVIYDDIVALINATSTGTTPARTLTFYQDSLPEATVQAHIDAAAAYLHFFLGDANWTSTDSIVAPAVANCYLFYATALVLAVLSGGMMISGFDITMSDVALKRSQRGRIYTGVAGSFLTQAQQLAMQLTQFQLTVTVSTPDTVESLTMASAAEAFADALTEIGTTITRKERVEGDAVDGYGDAAIQYNETQIQAFIGHSETGWRQTPEGYIQEETRQIRVAKSQDMNALDRVIIYGVEYEVSGPVEVWPANKSFKATRIIQ
jgi:hypothetical protein